MDLDVKFGHWTIEEKAMLESPNENWKVETMLEYTNSGKKKRKKEEERSKNENLLEGHSKHACNWLIDIIYFWPSERKKEW